MTIPLSNPDQFLTLTLPRVNFLFTRGFVICWAIALLGALGLVFKQWDEFLKPLNHLLAVQSLVFMWGAFCGLKIWHELGHGYACKRYGGHVPEMGCKLMMGMPLAYVDASSAWGFPFRSQRIYVMLGGMYFEGIVAVVAVYLWSLTPNSMLGAFAFHLIFMAGVATLLFNINPLMRYDGYFILSDMIGIQNLRAKAMKEVQATMKHWFLGLPHVHTMTQNERWILRTYGILSSLYLATLTLSIAGFLAIKLKYIGLVIAAVQLFQFMLNPLKQLWKYLTSSPEVESVRGRARLLLVGVFCAIPIALCVLPAPHRLRLTGVVLSNESTIVVAETPGHITELSHQLGRNVDAGEVLVRLENLDVSTSRIAQSMITSAAYRAAQSSIQTDLKLAAKLQLQAEEQEVNQRVVEDAVNQLTIVAPHAGKLVKLLPEYAVGGFVQKGDPVATIVDGETMVRAWLDEEQLRHAKLEVGSRVNVRFADIMGTPCMGLVRSVSPATPTEFRDAALTVIASERILVDPMTGQTDRPLFELLVSVPKIPGTVMSQHSRAFINVPARYEPLGAWLIRLGLAFKNRVIAS